MYFDGHIEITSLHTSGFDERIGQANLNFGLAPTRDNRLAIGFSLGVDAIDFNDANLSETAIYPAVTFAIGNTGLLSVGVPRSVLDRGYFPEPKFANNTLVDLELRTIEASVVGSHYLHSDDTIYGLRYDGTFGNTKVGVSYHYIDATSSNADAFAIAASHSFAGPSSMEDFMLYGGVEHLTTTTSDMTKYRIGA